MGAQRRPEIPVAVAASGVTQAVLLVALGLTFLLACLETLFHVIWPQPLYAVEFSPWGFSHIPETAFTHGSMAWLEGRLLGGREYVTHISYNWDGFRDYGYGYAKPPGTARILVLGDSYGEGMEVPFSDTFPKQLERLLNDWLQAGHRIPGRPTVPPPTDVAPVPLDINGALQTNSYDWPATRAILRGLQRSSAGAHSRLLAMLSVSWDSQAAAEREDYLRRIGADVLVVPDSRSDHYRYDVHWNPAGHEHAAQMAFQAIVAGHLIPLDDSIRQVQVINTSMSAYSTCKELMLFQAEGVKFAPDLTLLVYTPYENRNRADRAMCTLQPDGSLAIHPQTFGRAARAVRGVAGFIKSHSHFLTFVGDRWKLVTGGYRTDVTFGAEDGFSGGGR